MKIYKTTKQRSYIAFETGNVISKSITTGIEKAVLGHIREGYIHISIKRKNEPLHRIIATLYCPNPQNKPIVNHKDGNKLNNCASNLEWCTAYENNNHAFDMGLNTSKRLTDEQVIEIVNLYRTKKYSSHDLSKKFGVCERLIMSFHKGMVRKHLGIKDNGYRYNAGRPRKGHKKTGF